jgi:HK97 family phage prohead protease
MKPKTPAQRAREYGSGYMTVNEIRAREKLPEIPGDDGNALVHFYPEDGPPPLPLAREAVAATWTNEIPARARELGVVDGLRRHRSITLTDVRVSPRDGNKPRVFEGYAALFDVRAEIYDGWFEELAPGCFDSALARPDDVRFLINHDSNPTMVLGRSKSGTLELSIDEKGLKVRCELPQNENVNALASAMDRGDVDQMSFGFVPLDYRWTEFPDGSLLCRILDLELWDVSVVTFPAYSETSASLRAVPSHLTLPSERMTHSAGHDVLDEEQSIAWVLERAIELRAGAVLSSENRKLVENAVEALQALLEKASGTAENSARDADTGSLDALQALIELNEQRGVQLESERR